MTTSPVGQHSGKGVVVGVDGSASAKVAVDWAAREAALRDVVLTVVYVQSPPTVWMSPETPLPAGLVERGEEFGRRILDDAVEVARAATDSDSLQIDTEVVTGPTVPTLADLSKDARMIVVGSRGMGAVARRILGSASLGLLHHAQCPVAVIQDEDPLMPLPARAPVLVAIDGSPTSERATAVAFDEAARRGVDLIAVHAWRNWDFGQWPDLDIDEMQTRAEEVLSERLAGWGERYPDVTVERIVVCNNPAKAVLVESERAQLVVVGSHGRGGFAGMLLGSVSSAVVQASRMPVLVVRRSN